MDDLLLMDGYNDCLLGIVERAGMPPIACYDKDKVIACLRDDGMTQVEALEFFEFNQLGAWMGPKTPCFLTLEKTIEKTS
jgi:hypothetical protein